mgnify:FL=1
MKKSLRRIFVFRRGGEFCTAGRFLPALPQSVVYYKKWAAKVILERGNRV